MCFIFSTNSIWFRFVHLYGCFNVASFFVLHNNIIDFTACNSLYERKTSIGKDKHISCSIIVRLETSEIPTAKLIKVNDTVLVKIKIIEGFFKLIIIERMTEIRGKLLKLTLINSTTRVFVKLAESWFDIFFILLIVLFNHFFH